MNKGSILSSCLLFPIIGSVLLGIFLIVCYVIALNNGHIVSPPDVPLVSEVGYKAPESCIFTFVVTWGAIFQIIVIFAYYEYLKNHGMQSKLNKSALAAGILGAVGFTAVGSFQSSVVVPHTIGAFAAFIFGNIYCWLIVVINFKHLSGNLTKRYLVYVRTVCAALQTVGFSIFGISYAIYFANQSLTSVLKVSTVLEWCSVYLLFAFTCTYAFDFSNMKEIKMHVEVKNLQSENL